MNARPTNGPGSRLKENPMIGSNCLRAMTTAVALFLCATSALPGEGRRLTLTEAVRLAVQQNRALRSRASKSRKTNTKKRAPAQTIFQS